MAHRVIWADAAIADVDSAAEYIRRDSPVYSSVFVTQALEAGRSLSHFPLRGEDGP
jgi:plasmid stabilization system protein ParE